MVGESLLLLSAHLIADFPLQSDWMAANKLDDLQARLAHVLVHAVVMAVTLLMLNLWSWPFLIGYTVSHALIDTRRWASEKEGISSWPIIIDQIMHIASLAFLAVTIL